MALTAADAYRRAIDRFLGKLSGSETVGQMEKKVADHLRLAKLRPTVDVELSFNEAAGVLAISTAQLHHLLKEHAPSGTLFMVKGARKRSTTLTLLMAWAAELNAKGLWKPLSERGLTINTLLTAELPFLVAKGPKAKQFFLEPLTDQPITDAVIRQLQAFGAQIGLGIRVCTLTEAFAQPWQNPDVKRQWVDAFNNAAQAQASRLRDLAQQLDASRARVIEQALDERLNQTAQHTLALKRKRV
ncbi:hypothetical protein [Stenotrophomonas sp. TD3]|uniref:hypothetical protein n=1 Tax=Stenotrophomonas sp. TD3 TaxID=1641707 RepID=UPI0009518FEC|nr:hypothetical protein [Stenotrophomonas sp. TD3]